MRKVPEYQVLALDLVSNEVQGEIPWTSISVTEASNAPPSTSITMPLRDSFPRGVLHPSVFGVGRSAFVVLRGGLPLGKFILNDIEASYPDGLTARGNGTLSYLGRRRITSTVRFDNLDQFDLIRGLIDLMQNTEAGDLGIQVDAGLSGVIRSRRYFRSEQFTYESAVREFSESTEGFDWRERTGPGPEYTTSMELATEHRRQTDVVFDLRKNLRSLGVSYDANQLQNRFVTASKRVEASPPLFRTASDPNGLSIYPRYDGFEQTNIDPVADGASDLLGDRSAQRVAEFSRPVTNYTFEVNEDIDSDFSQYPISSICKLTADYGYLQVVNRNVLVNERTISVDSNGKETVTVGATSI